MFPFSMEPANAKCNFLLANRILVFVSLFVVRKPGEGRRQDVCDQMWKELEQVGGAVLLPADDQSGILDFASMLCFGWAHID